MSEPGSGSKRLVWGITRNILVAGIVSFLMDVSSEMVYAIGPLYAAALGAGPQVIGFIEGIAEATASVFKFFSGAIADRFQRYKPLVTIGYLISTLSRPIAGFAGAWHTYLGARIVDRFGKGVRTSPRDAILAASSQEKSYGKSFGLHRAMDQAGAIVGPLVASAVLALYVLDVPSIREFRVVIWWSLVPGLFAVVATLFLVETGKKRPDAKVEAKTEETKPAALSIGAAGDGRRYWYFLAVMLVFSIGNSSNAFIILRSRDLGMSEKLIPVAYATMNLVYVLASIPWGVLADRIGFRQVILIGFAVYAAVYFAFGEASRPWMMWVLFGAYGLFESAFEGQSRAYLARLAKEHMRGTAYGIYNMFVALAVFPASLIAGTLYAHDPAWAFYYGAVTAAAAFVMLAAERLVIRPARESGQ